MAHANVVLLSLYQLIIPTIPPRLREYWNTQPRKRLHLLLASRRPSSGISGRGQLLVRTTAVETSS